MAISTNFADTVEADEDCNREAVKCEGENRNGLDAELRQRDGTRSQQQNCPHVVCSFEVLHQGHPPAFVAFVVTYHIITVHLAFFFFFKEQEKPHAQKQLTTLREHYQGHH